MLININDVPIGTWFVRQRWDINKSFNVSNIKDDNIYVKINKLEIMHYEKRFFVFIETLPIMKNSIVDTVDCFFTVTGSQD